MHTLALTTEELDLLHDLLRHGLNEINLEVSRTDTHDYKAMLKHRQTIIEQLLEKIPVPVEPLGT